jgi:Low psii accumulation1 / Rep27
MFAQTCFGISPVVGANQICQLRPTQISSRRPMRLVVRAADKGSDKNTTKSKNSMNNLDRYQPPRREEAELRAEAEAPFRSLRLVLFGFGGVSAALATFFSLPKLIGSLAGAANGKPITEAGQDFAINVGIFLLCGFFLKRDLDAREKQMARLLREDALGACRLELANGKLLRLGQLRGAARPVIVAGTPAQVKSALEAAEPYKEELALRGVLVIGLPIYLNSSGNGSAMTQESIEAAASSELPPLKKDDLRWRAVPIRTDDWRKWFDEQAAAASKATEKGLYVGLRKDGRVRASGLGCPPWAQFAAQLPPEDGTWGGFLDGMDGVV